MEIWIVTYADANWQEQHEVMVIAETEHDARTKASATHGDEGADAWFNPDKTDAVTIGAAYHDTDASTTVRDYLES